MYTVYVWGRETVAGVEASTAAFFAVENAVENAVEEIALGSVVRLSSESLYMPHMRLGKTSYGLP